MNPILDDGGLNRVVRGRHGVFAYNRHDIYIGRALEKYGEFSELEAQLLLELCRPKDVIVEVGANIGAHTVHLANRVGPAGRVVAFEPQPPVFQLLCANMALNSLTHVTCVPAAVGRRAGQLFVPELRYEQANNFGGVSLDRATAGVPVECVTLDEYLDLPSLRLLKIDVEGMEQPVIEGAVQTIRRHRPALYVENDRVDRSRPLIETIMALDYELYWHLPQMFNPDNFADDQENVFGNIVSFNMLCVPGDRASQVSGLPRIEHAAQHPLRRYSAESATLGADHVNQPSSAHLGGRSHRPDHDPAD